MADAVADGDIGGATLLPPASAAVPGVTAGGRQEAGRSRVA
jgi:hypothetical protein